MSWNKKQTKDDSQGKARESTGSAAATTLDLQNGDVRAAVFGLLKNDADIMKTIIDAVSQAIVRKLLDTPSLWLLWKTERWSRPHEDDYRCRQSSHREETAGHSVIHDFSEKQKDKADLQLKGLNYSENATSLRGVRERRPSRETG